MNTIQIQTAQNVFIEYQPAGVGDRILAFIIDSVIKIAYLVVLGLIANFLPNKSFLPSFIEDIIGFIAVIPIFFYTLALEIFMDGQTIGKRAMQIKVVMLDGTQPTIGTYILRWLVRLIDLSFMGIVGIVTISSNAKGQRLGDMAANTTVITLKRRVTLAQTALPQTDASYQVVYPQVTRLSDRDIEIIRETLQTYHRNGNDPYLLSSLANKLQSLLGISSDQSYLDFLETILRDYTHITSNQ